MNIAHRAKPAAVVGKTQSAHASGMLSQGGTWTDGVVLYQGVEKYSGRITSLTKISS